MRGLSLELSTTNNYGQSGNNNYYDYRVMAPQGGDLYQGNGGGRNWQHGGGQGVGHLQYGGSNLAATGPHLQQCDVGTQRREDVSRHGPSFRQCGVAALQQRVVSQQHGKRGRLHRDTVRPYNKAESTATLKTGRGPAPVCNLCSYRQRPPARKKEVRHHHFSSRQVRILAGVEKNEVNVEKNGTAYLCPTCGENGALGRLHSMEERKRLPVLVSSSVLHEHFLSDYEGDKVHMDYVTAPGAKIEELEQMWEREYREVKKEIDVLLVAGGNNIRSDSLSQFMHRVHNFLNTVMAHNKNNTFRVATLLMSPCYVWFEGNGPVPTPGYDNKLEKVVEINKQIASFNQDQFELQKELYKRWGGGEVGEKDPTPMFHTHGVRNWRGKQQHRMNKWRESVVEKKLHLTDKGRNDLARFAGRYFQEMFVPRAGSLPAWARDDEEQEEGHNDMRRIFQDAWARDDAEQEEGNINNDRRVIVQDTVGSTEDVPPDTAATSTAISITTATAPDAPEVRAELSKNLDKMRTYLAKQK